jgi:site-specific recombinase XerD
LVVSARSEKAGSALSAPGIYAVLKRFFRQAAKSAAAAGLDAQRFEKASTHWMRHTFVRQALVDGVPIEVASELAGHASIDTTSIYSTQELARKIKAVRGMRRRVAA